MTSGTGIYPILPTRPTGTELRAVRQAMGLTQAELAAMLHVNPKIPSRWENGITPQPSTLHLIHVLYRTWLNNPRNWRRMKREALA